MRFLDSLYEAFDFVDAIDGGCCRERRKDRIWELKSQIYESAIVKSKSAGRVLNYHMGNGGLNKWY